VIRRRRRRLRLTARRSPAWRRPGWVRPVLGSRPGDRGHGPGNAAAANWAGCGHILTAQEAAHHQ